MREGVKGVFVADTLWQGADCGVDCVHGLLRRSQQASRHKRHRHVTKRRHNPRAFPPAEQHVEGWLQGLDCVGEGDGHCSKADVGGNVADRVHEGGTKDGAKLLLVDGLQDRRKQRDGIDDSSRSKRAQAVRRVDTATTNRPRPRQGMALVSFRWQAHPCSCARGWGVRPASQLMTHTLSSLTLPKDHFLSPMMYTRAQ